MFLSFPVETDAARALYESDQSDMGFVMNLTQLWAWRPELHTAFAALRGALTSRTSLTAREQAVIVCSVASSSGDSYCSLAWGRRLATASDAATAAAVLSGAAAPALNRRESALREWVRQVATDANATTAQGVQALREAGFTDADVFDATALAAFRLAFSTVNDALGVNPDAQLAEAAPPEVRQAVRFGRPVGAEPPR